METPRKYGVALDGATPGSLYVRIPIRKAGSADYATGSDWTPATGDVKVVKDAGAPANIATLPSYVNGSWQFALSAAELTAKLIEVRIVDSATKAVDDAGFNIFTFGHASAFIPVDYADGVRFGMTALPNAAAGANGGLPVRDANGRVSADKTAIMGVALTSASADNWKTFWNNSGVTYSGNMISQLSSSIGNVTLIVNRIGGFTGSGVNTVLGAFKALLSKSATLPTDIGGTFDPTTDSVEAIRDRGDVFWVTATGFAVAGDQMNLVDNAITSNKIASGALNSIWSVLTSTFTGAGSVGKLLKDMLDVAISTRSAPGDAMTLTAGQITIIRDDLERAGGSLDILLGRITSGRAGGLDKLVAHPMSGSAFSVDVASIGVTPLSNIGTQVRTSLATELTTINRLATMVSIVGAGPSYQYTAQALALAPAGGGGGGGLTTEQDTKLETIFQKTSLITAGKTTIVSPLGPSGLITLIQGFDWPVSDNAGIVVEEPYVSAWPAYLDTATDHLLFAVKKDGTEEFQGTGEILAPLGDGRRRLGYSIVKDELTDWPGKYEYYLGCLLASGNRVAFSSGELTLKRGPSI